MKNKALFETTILLLPAVAIWLKIAQLAPQWALRWKFISLLCVTSLLIVSLAIYFSRRTALHHKIRAKRRSYIFLLCFLPLPFVAALLPPRQTPYFFPGQNVNELALPLPVINPLVEREEIIALPKKERTLLDWVKLFSSTQFESYQGEAVDISGVVSDEGGLTAKQFTISRLTLTCCVAEPINVGLTVNWPEASTLSAGSWVRVRGYVLIKDEAGEKYPQIQADSVEMITQPDQPYLYSK